MLPLSNTTYSWIQVILWQISLYKAFHSIGNSYENPIKWSLHRIINCRGFAENRGLPRIQNSFAETFLHERICCNVIFTWMISHSCKFHFKKGIYLHKLQLPFLCSWHSSVNQRLEEFLFGFRDREGRPGSDDAVVRQGASAMLIKCAHLAVITQDQRVITQPGRTDQSF